MPCARPPCTWPSTISGLIGVPTSSTQTYLRSLTNPVSVSISTQARCVPCGKEKFSGSYTASESRLGSTPSGRSWAMKAANATSPMATDEPGAPLTENEPPLNSRSSSLASSMCAAIFFAFSTTFSVALTMAMPPTASEREP